MHVSFSHQEHSWDQFEDSNSQFGTHAQQGYSSQFVWVSIWGPGGGGGGGTHVILGVPFALRTQHCDAVIRPSDHRRRSEGCQTI